MLEKPKEAGTLYLMLHLRRDAPLQHGKQKLPCVLFVVRGPLRFASSRLLYLVESSRNTVLLSVFSHESSLSLFLLARVRLHPQVKAGRLDIAHPLQPGARLQDAAGTVRP